jgi:hypothetical protein
MRQRRSSKSRWNKLRDERSGDGHATPQKQINQKTEKAVEQTRVSWLSCRMPTVKRRNSVTHHTATKYVPAPFRVSIHLALCILYCSAAILSNSLYMPSETAKSPEVARLVPAMAVGERQIPISRARQIPISRVRVFGEAPAEVW